MVSKMNNGLVLILIVSLISLSTLPIIGIESHQNDELKIGDIISGIGRIQAEIKNLGARSMIEYPLNSGNIAVGTFKMINLNPLVPWEGCDLWIRSS